MTPTPDPLDQAAPAQIAGWSPAEERANAATHALGLVLAGIGVPVLLLQAATVRATVAAALFSAALIFLYAASSLYHACRPGTLKRVFLALDHAGIFLLIAGSYAPFALVALAPESGTPLILLVGLLALAGLVLQAALFSTGRAALFERLAPLLHLGLGWIPLMLFGEAVLEALSPDVLTFLVAGGLAYTLGVVAFLRRSLPYGHAIWHLAVVAGSALHFVGILSLVSSAAGIA